MADYVLNAYVWNMGHDEADELCQEIASVLARRGHALQESDTDPLRSIVALCPVDFSNSEDEALSPEEIFDVIAQGSRVLMIPHADGEHELHRANGT